MSDKLSKLLLCRWPRGWAALVMVAGLAQASCALAQMYKCTDANGRTAFSDVPCARLPGAAGSAGVDKDGVKQEVLRQPAPSASNTSPDAISAMCTKSEGARLTDQLIESLPEMQREMVRSVLRGVLASVARDPKGQETLNRVTLRMDAARNAIICVPRQLARPRGAAPVTAYIAHRIEPNGRLEILQPGARPQVYNDANEPVTVASRCSGLVVSCVWSKEKSEGSIDHCFETAPRCPSGRLDPALICCPQACKDAYRRERARGTEAVEALSKVIFGDKSGAASCVPGMPKKG